VGGVVSVHAPPSPWTHERLLAVELNCEKQICAYGAYIHSRLAGARQKVTTTITSDGHTIIDPQSSPDVSSSSESTEVSTTKDDHMATNDASTPQSLMVDLLREFLISEGVDMSLFNDNDDAASTTRQQQQQKQQAATLQSDVLTADQIAAIQSPDDEPWYISNTVTDYHTVRSIHAKSSANQAVIVASSTMSEEGVWSTYPYLVPLDADRRHDPIEMINLGSGTTFIDVAINTGGNLIATLDSRNVILILEKVAYLGLDDDDLAWEVALKLTMPTKLKNYPPIKLQLIDAHRRGTKQKEETTFLGMC
jgi:hypothetical protein